MQKVIAGLKAAASMPRTSRPHPSASSRATRGPSRAQAPKIDGYSVTNEVQVVVRDLDKLGDILDRLVTARRQPDGGALLRSQQGRDAARRGAQAGRRQRAASRQALRRGRRRRGRRGADDRGRRRRGAAADGDGARDEGGSRAHRARHRDAGGQRHHHLGAEVAATRG